MRIIIITPVRNEEKYIRATISSIVKQTLIPSMWIIVNDGSKDNTEKIISRFARKYEFIKSISLPDRGYRLPGQGVVEAFYQGYNRIKNVEYDVLAKLDGDLEFPSDTLQTIALAFESDSRLGITGATRYEKSRYSKSYKKVLVPNGFVGGPAKFYRKECFEQIGGLICRAGWDGVDTITANMKGWKTSEIESIKLLHLRPTGASKGEGLRRSCEKYGNVSYYMGGYLWYFILRLIFRSILGRNILIGYYMLKAYVEAKMNGAPRETLAFRSFLKKRQIRNLYHWIK